MQVNQHYITEEYTGAINIPKTKAVLKSIFKPGRELHALEQKKCMMKDNRVANRKYLGGVGQGNLYEKGGGHKLQ